MRARNIKPGFFKNEVLAQMSEKARLLFVGLWCCADRDGLLEDRPDRIRADVFPYDMSKIDNLISELEKNGFVHRYSSQGINVIKVVAFLDHQRPHHTEAKSKMPRQEITVNSPLDNGELTVNPPLDNREPTVSSPEVHGEVTVNSPLPNGEYPPDSLIHGFTDSLIPDSLKEDSLNKKRAPREHNPEFDKFWECFPRGRKKGRGEAIKAWKKAIKLESPEIITASALEYSKSDEGRGQYVKMPATWLNQQCWLDDRTAWGDPAKPLVQSRVATDEDMENYRCVNGVQNG